MSTNARTGKDAREALMVGVDMVADAVKLTLGAAGANAVIEVDLPPYHRVTNDGVTVAQSIKPAWPVHRMGANIMKEIATRADKDSGDGTTTATVLAQAILKEGMELDMNPMEIKRSLDECLPLIYASIDAQKKDITPDEVGKVALSSSEDQEMADLLQKIYQEIGAEGIVEMDNSNVAETFYEVVDGVRLRGARYMGEYCTTEPGKAVYKNPKILISKDKIVSADQIEPIVAAVATSGKSELVIYCEDMDLSVLSRLALTHLNGGFKTLVIKSPTLWKDWLYEDFALLTGATAIDSTAGKTFRTVSMSDLGTCEQIITTKDETRVLGTKDVSEHITRLKEEGETDDQQKLRAAWLQTKVAVLKVGANSDSELSYKRLKAIDAINACHLALEDGVVPGGGVTLRNAALSMPDTVGGNILIEALRAPLIQIVSNSGLEPAPELVLAGDNKGWDAKGMEEVDMWEAGILDPAKVTKNAVKNAISTAGTILTTNVVISLTDKDYEGRREM